MAAARTAPPREKACTSCAPTSAACGSRIPRAFCTCDRRNRCVAGKHRHGCLACRREPPGNRSPGGFRYVVVEDSEWVPSPSVWYERSLRGPLGYGIPEIVHFSLGSEHPYFYCRGTRESLEPSAIAPEHSQTEIQSLEHPAARPPTPPGSR